MRLYHYTCSHSQPQISKEGVLIPGKDGFLWLTDLDAPMRDALGLTSNTLICDRTEYRFEVETEKAVHWKDVRRVLPDWYRALLEEAPGAMPMHWWMATEEIPVLSRVAVSTHG